MTGLQALKRELPTTALQVAISAIGFLIALAINTALADRSEKDTYKSLLDSVRTEAKMNDDIRSSSFEKYYKNGLVLREFTLLSTSQSLANPIFVKYASASDFRALNNYVLNLSLANAYRRISENVYLTDRNNRSLRDTITSEWERVLSASSTAIGSVEALED